MISVSDYVEKLLAKDSAIRELLNSNLLNTSQYAQLIQPQLEKALFRKVAQNSIVTALSRAKSKNTISKSQKLIINDIQIIYPITDLVFSRSNSPTQSIAGIYTQLAQNPNHYINLTVGNNEINVFINTRYRELIKTALQKEKLIFEKNDLCSINLKFDPSYIDVPGILYSVLRVLNWNQINLIEAVSTFSEITLFVEQQDSQILIELIRDEFITGGVS